MEEVFQFLRENSTFYLATAEEDQPRVRPFGAVDLYEGKLYIQTGNTKQVFAQMLKNPNIEICASGKDGRWLRVAAKAVRDDRREARQHMLDANPELKDMYSADDGICEVFYLKDAVGAFYTFGKNPETVRF